MIQEAALWVGIAHVVYWGSDSKFYHGTYSAGAWDGAGDLIAGLLA